MVIFDVPIRGVCIAGLLLLLHYHVAIYSHSGR